MNLCFQTIKKNFLRNRCKGWALNRSNKFNKFNAEMGYVLLQDKCPTWKYFINPFESTWIMINDYSSRNMNIARFFFNIFSPTTNLNFWKAVQWMNSWKTSPHFLKEASMEDCGAFLEGYTMDGYVISFKKLSSNLLPFSLILFIVQQSLKSFKTFHTNWSLVKITNYQNDIQLSPSRRCFPKCHVHWSNIHWMCCPPWDSWETLKPTICNPIP
jgi:hypothetical protein